MTKMLFVPTLLVSLACVAIAQDNRVSPPLTVRERVQAMSAGPAQPRTAKANSAPPFCPPQTCLYYAGDFDSTDSNANGLLNADYDNGEYVGQVWVGVKPPKAVTVTGATFNQLLTPGFMGTNPTPFQTQVGIVQGAGGTLVCNTYGTATATYYGGNFDGLPEVSYSIKKLAKSCKIQARKNGATYVNLLPIFSTGYGYLTDVEDAKPANHYGWKNDLDDSYFNGSEYPYQPTWGSSGACGGGCDEFSIALTGRK
jgi:hypothetical protein